MINQFWLVHKRSVRWPILSACKSHLHTFFHKIHWKSRFTETDMVEGQHKWLHERCDWWSYETNCYRLLAPHYRSNHCFLSTSLTDFLLFISVSNFTTKNILHSLASNFIDIKENTHNYFSFIDIQANTYSYLSWLYKQLLPRQHLLPLKLLWLNQQQFLPYCWYWLPRVELHHCQPKRC